MLTAISRVYADVNKNELPSYYLYERVNLNFGWNDNYEIVKRLGAGKYSQVFGGIDVSNNQKIVIKILNPINLTRIKREIKILENLRGGPNIISLLSVTKEPISRAYNLIFDTISEKSFRLENPTDADVRYYLNEILKALDYAHSKGIMHRDLKPGNIILNEETRSVRLIDWGLGEFYHPGKIYSYRVASRFFKGPELLATYQTYDYSLDMWSLGCVAAGLIFKKEPFFAGQNDNDQLIVVTQVLGSQALMAYLIKYGIVLEPHFIRILTNHQKKDWNQFANNKNKKLVVPEALDFLDKILKFDQHERMTAKEAMEHPYIAHPGSH